VRAAVREAFRAGVDGIVISRKYSEMRLDTLSGVGDAVKELQTSWRNLPNSPAGAEDLGKG